MPREIEKQQVWRTFSEEKNGGFRVWEVMQVHGTLTPKQIHPTYMMQARDGTYIYIMCSHFRTRKAAIDMMDRNGEDWFQTIKFIDSPKPLYPSKPMPY